MPQGTLHGPWTFLVAMTYLVGGKVPPTSGGWRQGYCPTPPRIRGGPTEKNEPASEDIGLKLGSPGLNAATQKARGEWTSEQNVGNSMSHSIGGWHEGNEGRSAPNDPDLTSLVALHGPDVTQPPEDSTASQQGASSWVWLLSQSCTQVVSRKTNPYLVTVNIVMEKAMGEKITGIVFKMLQQNQTNRGGGVPQRRVERRPAQRVSLGDGLGTTVTLCPVYH